MDCSTTQRTVPESDDLLAPTLRNGRFDPFAQPLAEGGGVVAPSARMASGGRRRGVQPDGPIRFDQDLSGLDVGQSAHNVEIAYTPTDSSWLNRIEAQFTALRCFTLDGTDHASHREQGSMICRYVTRRNKHTPDERLRKVVARANVAWIK
ncbi:hypothetical protein SAMN06272771_0087 [Streptomyces sp. Ag82_O1-12]|nr:hypothetical protein SAMN06272771_0087 [Streptomyces sp. Ag82_O1-12]SOD42844.1 hypothetical protein SAMN06272727_0077 [Streptomyces sp. Ag82_G6-1]